MGWGLWAGRRGPRASLRSCRHVEEGTSLLADGLEGLLALGGNQLVSLLLSKVDGELLAAHQIVFAGLFVVLALEELVHRASIHLGSLFVGELRLRILGLGCLS